MTGEFARPVALSRRALLAGAAGLGLTAVAGCTAPELRGGAAAAGARVPSGYPRAWFFRQTESAWRLPYDEWKRRYGGLGGAEGKAFGEEIGKRTEEEWARIREHFARLKREDPDQLILLHFNGKAARPEFMGPGFFAGHWLYYAGTPLAREVASGGRTLYVADPGVFRMKRPDGEAGPDEIVIAPTGPDGRPDFGGAVHATIDAIGGGAVTLREPVAKGFPAGSHVAAHVRLRPPKQPNVLWAYNMSGACPRDGAGRTCADVLVSMLAGWFRDGGPLAAYDGVQFDVLYFLPDLRPVEGGGRFAATEHLIDVDNDRRPDAGIAGGHNVFGDGVVRFLAALRKRLPGKIIMADGMQPEAHPRSFRTLSGIESEGFPRLGDRRLDEWSGGLNRHAFWAARGAAPRLNYMVTKNVGDGAGHMCPDDYRQLRLIFAAAMYTGAAVAQAPFIAACEGPASGADQVFDELVNGTANERGWLGRPMRPAVHLAAGARDLLAGAGESWPADFVAARFRGAGARFAAVAGPALRVRFDPVGGGRTSPDTGAPIRTFRLTGIDLRGPAFVRLALSGEPLPGYPAEIGRRIMLRAGGSERISGFFDGETSTSTFYFREVRTTSLVFEVEGDRPVTVAGLLVTSADDGMYREFERGAVLANPSDRPYAFDLARLMPGRSFRRIAGGGRQSDVNDGRPVRGPLTLPARDGLALVKVADE